MPRIGWMHPQVIHFVVACLFVGLPAYWLSFLKRPRFLRPMAAILLIIGTGAAFVAVKSGLDAHGFAERIPGARAAVSEHEELGILTRNIFAGVLVLELVALGLAWRAGGAGRVGGQEVAGSSTMRSASKGVSLVVAVAWTVGCAVLFDAADHGGDLVYDYAGGVGFRSGGDTTDVDQLLLAGLFGESQMDRQAGRHEDAARLVSEMVRRYPQNTDVQLLGVESLLVDVKDGRAALDRLATLNLPDDPRSQVRKATYSFDAYMLLQMPDSARVALDQVPERYRQSRMVTERRAKLGG